MAILTGRTENNTPALVDWMHTVDKSDTSGNPAGTSKKTEIEDVINTGNKRDATAAPTVNDDSANTSGDGIFTINSTWIDVTADNSYLCVDDTPTAAVWVQTNGVVGDVVGPAGAVDNGFALFDGVTGKLIKDNGTTIATAQIADDAVTNAKAAEMVQKTVKGRADAAGTGDPTDLTGSQVLAVIDLEPTDTPTFDEVNLTTTTPSDASKAASKQYVDGVASGLDIKEACRLAEVAILDDNSTISGSPTYDDTGGSSARGQITATLNVSDSFTMDAVVLSSTDDGTRILIKDEGLGGGLGGDANGIWTTTIVGTALTLDRATDFDQDAEVTQGAFTLILEGTVNAAKGYVLTTADPITIGGVSGTSLTFTLFSGAGGVTNLTFGNRTATTYDIESDSGGDATVLAATTSLAGNFPAADKTKLDGVATGATNNTGALADLDTVGTAEIDAAAVTNVELANMVQKTIKGRADAAGTGDPVDLIGAQVLAIVDLEPTDAVQFLSVQAFRPLVSETGTSKTLALSDKNTKQEGDNAGTQTFTIPTNASVAYAVGTEIEFIQKGAGSVVITGDTGVTVNGISAGSVSIQNQFSGATIYKSEADVWIALGDL